MSDFTYNDRMQRLVSLVIFRDSIAFALTTSPSPSISVWVFLSRTEHHRSCFDVSTKSCGLYDITISTVYMDLANYPAISPPPGVTPNFIDPETRAPLVIVFSAISLGLMLPILVARLYTKAWVLHSSGWDDGTSNPVTWNSCWYRRLASALFAGVWLIRHLPEPLHHMLNII